MEELEKAPRTTGPLFWPPLSIARTHGPGLASHRRITGRRAWSRGPSPFAGFIGAGRVSARRASLLFLETSIVSALVRPSGLCRASMSRVSHMPGVGGADPPAATIRPDTGPTSDVIRLAGDTEKPVEPCRVSYLSCALVVFSRLFDPSADRPS